jgi:hypothetical protein
MLGVAARRGVAYEVSAVAQRVQRVQVSGIISVTPGLGGTSRRPDKSIMAD